MIVYFLICLSLSTDGELSKKSVRLFSHPIISSVVMDEQARFTLLLGLAKQENSTSSIGLWNSLPIFGHRIAG